LAASITRATLTGAEAGAISRPSTSVAFSGGGGGGTNTAPPPDVEVETWAPAAGASAATPVRHASTMAACSSVLRAGEGILFRTPAGLADGLALKELARPLEREFAPVAEATLGSPAPR
jgi:hypothetical protein